MERATIGLEQLGARSASELAARSRRALDRPLAHDAELSISEVANEATLLGAYQRGASMPVDRTLFRRGSGGPSVLVGPGTIHVLLALAQPSSLAPCTADKLVNRYVRPLLRALTRVGATAHYFGRDWVSVQHRPAAWVGFAHARDTGRAVIEAFVAVTRPFALEGSSFLGKVPGTLASITGREIESVRVIDAIAEAYPAAYGREPVAFSTPEGDDKSPEDSRADPPWAATSSEAIGEVAAGRDRAGVLRVGGDLMVTREAIAHIERDLAALAPDAEASEVARAVDAAFDAPGIALDGVRSLESLVDVIVRARA